MTRWFVAIAKNGRALRAVDELDERGFETYAPIEKTYRRLRGSKRKIEAPLLGRYLFVQIPDDNGFHKVRTAPDVFDLLSDEAGPRAVDERFVSELRADEDAGKFDKTKRDETAFAEGQKVVLTKGAFRDQIGQLVRFKGHRRWEVFLAAALGGGVGKMDVAEEEMEPAPAQQGLHLARTGNVEHRCGTASHCGSEQRAPRGMSRGVRCRPEPTENPPTA